MGYFASARIFCSSVCCCIRPPSPSSSYFACVEEDSEKKKRGSRMRREKKHRIVRRRRRRRRKTAEDRGLGDRGVDGHCEQSKRNCGNSNLVRILPTAQDAYHRNRQIVSDATPGTPHYVMQSDATL